MAVEFLNIDKITEWVLDRDSQNHEKVIEESYIKDLVMIDEMEGTNDEVTIPIANNEKDDENPTQKIIREHDTYNHDLEVTIRAELVRNLINRLDTKIIEDSLRDKKFIDVKES